MTNELRLFVTVIASGYLHNPFHNFEHASHVILSANKLLKRIMNVDDDKYGEELTSADLHDHTFGIGSDPITHFAVVFSALCHDVCHTGVPNFRLAAENPELAQSFQHKCVAEQHSINVAWELLMLPDFRNLRAGIFRSLDEYQRFRQVVINSIIATDIFDKDLNSLRTSRWDKAFHGNETGRCPDNSDRKATIVIEHTVVSFKPLMSPTLCSIGMYIR